MATLYKFGLNNMDIIFPSRFTPLVVLVDEDPGLDSIVTNSNKAVIDTETELLG